MPRRKRSSDEADLDYWGRQTSKKSRAAASQRKRTDGEASFSSKRCVAWFTEYTDPDSPDMLGPEGMEKFCEDISVEPENIVMLCLAYKLGAKQMGFFSKAEWLHGMTELQCDSTGKLQSKLEHLRMLLHDSATFKAIYRYAFDFAREKEQRSMDIDTAKAMLALLLGKHWTLFPHFNQFLERSKYKVLNKDQWSNVLEFSRLIHSDLANYDEDGAWPVILDEFVEWHREQFPTLQKTSTETDVSSTQTPSSSSMQIL